MANAIALTGAIIESCNGGLMRYYRRCNFCQDVPNSTTQSTIPSVGNIMTGNFHCSKCRRDTQIKIKGI